MAQTQKHAEFPLTKWSAIRKAASVTSPASRAALEELCQAYWPPLYAYLRRSGHDPHHAKDLVQGYLARLLERQDLAAVSPEKGRFRTYLLTGLRNFLVSEARREGAQKRGGEVTMLSLDVESAEALYADSLAESTTPDLAYDRRWAETILQRGLASLRQEYATRGKGDLYDALKGAIAAAETEDYATLGNRLGLKPGAVAVLVHRLRTRLRELVRAEVMQTVGSAADLEEEMRNLQVILCQ